MAARPNKCTGFAVDIEGLRRANTELQAVADRFHILDRTDGPLTFERLFYDVQTLRAELEQDDLLVVIDYLQIVPHPQAFKSLKEKIDALLDGFVQVQRQTGATMLLISQKNRSGYERSGLDTLMGSAGIEYAADLVCLLNHTSTEDPMTDAAVGFRPVVPVELVVAKNRYGARGRLHLEFEGAYANFAVQGG